MYYKLTVNFTETKYFYFEAENDEEAIAIYNDRNIDIPNIIKEDEEAETWVTQGLSKILIDEGEDVDIDEIDYYDYDDICWDNK